MSEEKDNYQLARNNTLTDVGKTTSDRINKALPETMQASASIFGLDIKPDADPDDLLKAGDLFARSTVLNQYNSGVNKFSLGDIVRHAALAGQQDTKEVIADMKLEEKTGNSLRTIYSWVQTAERIGHKHRHANLSWSHFAVAASYKGVNRKTDPLGYVKFEQARMALLDMIAVDPDKYSLDWLREQLKLLQSAGQVVPKKIIPKKELFEYGAKLLCMQATLGPADLAGIGKTQADLTDAIEELQNELINRDIIDPNDLVWPNLPGTLGGEEPPDEVEVEAKVVEEKGGDDEG